MSRQKVTTRDVAAGDLNDLQLQVRDLGQQLNDRKHANTLLTTENARLKKQLYDLQQRITSLETGKATKRGEASSIGALRTAVRRPAHTHAPSTAQPAEHARQRRVCRVPPLAPQTLQAKQQSLLMAQDFQQVMQENQALVDQLGALQQQLDAAQQEAAEAQGGWKAARQDVEALQQQSDDLEAKCLQLMDQVEKAQAQAREAQQVRGVRLARAASPAGGGGPLRIAAAMWYRPGPQ